MRNILGFILLIGCFLQNFNSPPWQAAHSESFAFLAVLMWIWGVTRCNASVQIRLNPPVIILLCVNAIILIQYGTGQIEFGGDVAVLLIYVQLCISVLLVAQYHNNEAEWTIALALTLLVTALVSSLIALIQALGVWEVSDLILQYSGFRRPGANLGQPNHLATLLVMGAASLIYLVQRVDISRPVTVLLSLVLLLGMGITESRTGLLGGIALCLWWFARRQIFSHTVRWQWVMASALGLVAIMWGWPPLISRVQEAGPLQNWVMINTTTSGRMEVWQQLWEAVWIKPWFGWGLRGVSAALNAVQHNYAQSLPFTYAHNIILDLLLGMGIPLTAIALCAAGVWMWQRIKNAQTIQYWYAVGLLIPLGMHSLFEYPFAYAYFLVPAMLAIGMLEEKSKRSMAVNISRKIIFGFFLLFGSLLLWLCVEYINIEEDFRIARFESVNLGQAPAGYEHPNIILLTQLKALVAVTRTTPRPNMAQDEIVLLRKATLRFPWVPVQNCYALSLALNGDPKEAIRQLKVLRATHGQKVYERIKANWTELAHTQYPQLNVLALP